MAFHDLYREARMPGELLLGVPGKIAMEVIIEEAVKLGGPPLIAGLRQIIKDWNKTPHPSLKNLRTICDWLEPFRRHAESESVGTPPWAVYDFSKLSVKHFRQDNLTIHDIAELWFRTDTNLWRAKLQEIATRWASLSALSAPDRVHYFRGFEVDFNYGAVKEPEASRHPVFRSVHPFIMLTQVPRTKLGNTPIAEVVEFFVDGWEAFVVDGYTTFKAGTAIKLDTQAYVEGYFGITPKGHYRIGNDTIGTDVTLWRCVIVTASAHSVDILNVGIPASHHQGEQYLGYFYSWMEEFKKLVVP
jgi:hypothetical protein